MGCLFYSVRRRLRSKQKDVMLLESIRHHISLVLLELPITGRSPEPGAGAQDLQGSQRAQNGFGCPLRIPELARARPALRCAPFKYSRCMGGIRCVAIYIYIFFYFFFGAEEMGFGPQRSPTSKYDFELEKRVLYALCRANRFEPTLAGDSSAAFCSRGGGHPERS
jgi:hypothetical protein